MARTKTVSQNIAVLVGPTPATGLHATGSIFPLVGITSLDYSWSQNKQDVITYGKLASRERVAIDPPEVPLNITYYLGAGYNEDKIGLNAGDYPTQSALKYILDKTGDEKNYFVFIAPEGADAENLSGATSDISVVGIGNGFVNSYSVEASIGDFPTVSVGIQSLNIKTYTNGMNQQIPAVDPTTGLEITGKTFSIPNVFVTGYGTTEPYVIRPGDITLDLASAGGLFYDYSVADVQSFRVSFDLNRQPLNKLGSRFSVSREIQFPVNVNFEATMLAKDLRTGSLANFLCSTGGYNAVINLKYNSCAGTGTNAFRIELKNISLEGQQWSTQAGSDPQTVTATWVGQIGGTGDLNNGLFLSGAGINVT